MVVLHFHMVCKIFNLNVWNAKDLTHGSQSSLSQNEFALTLFVYIEHRKCRGKPIFSKYVLLGTFPKLYIYKHDVASKLQDSLLAPSNLRSYLLKDNIARVCPDLEKSWPHFTIDSKMKKSLQSKNFLWKEVRHF